MGKSHDFFDEEITQQQDHPDRDQVADRVGALDHVEERPVVGGYAGLRIFLREMTRNIFKPDRLKGFGIGQNGILSLLHDECGGGLQIVEHSNGQRFSGAG